VAELDQEQLDEVERSIRRFVGKTSGLLLGSRPGREHRDVDDQRAVRDDEPRLTVWTTRDPADVQLVACTERDDDTESVQTCPFDDDPPTPLRFASYTLHVYEASTGVESGTSQIEARNDTCPSSALVDENDPVVFSTPSPQQYLDALRGFVNRP
jgi:hypothetical protein